MPDRAPDVALVKWRLPGASVLWGDFNGVRQVGEPESDATDDLFLGINLTGAGLARQRGREIEIGEGDAMAVGMRHGPFTVLRSAPTRLIGCVLRAEPCTSPSTAAPTGRCGSCRPRTPRCSCWCATCAACSAAPFRPPQLGDAVVAHVSELVALSLAEPEADSRPPDRRGQTVRAIRAARLSAVKSDIDRHLTDPGLTASAVAGRHGITTRYMHKLFEPEPNTYSMYVLQRRLDLARRRLVNPRLNPRLSARSIAAIANDVGFGDLSYFNRAFRRRYGTTPSEVRRRHRQAE